MTDFRPPKILLMVVCWTRVSKICSAAPHVDDRIIIVKERENDTVIHGRHLQLDLRRRNGEFPEKPYYRLRCMCPTVSFSLSFTAVYIPEISTTAAQGGSRSSLNKPKDLLLQLFPGSSAHTTWT
jgi:hypothetical protein